MQTNINEIILNDKSGKNGPVCKNIGIKHKRMLDKFIILIFNVLDIFQLEKIKQNFIFYY